jgi:hypothetical protein
MSGATPESIHCQFAATATGMMRKVFDDEVANGKLREMIPWPNHGTPEEVAKVCVRSVVIESFAQTSTPL